MYKCQLMLSRLLHWDYLLSHSLQQPWSITNRRTVSFSGSYILLLLQWLHFLNLTCHSGDFQCISSGATSFSSRRTVCRTVSFVWATFVSPFKCPPRQWRVAIYLSGSARNFATSCPLVCSLSLLVLIMWRQIESSLTHRHTFVCLSFCHFCPWCIVGCARR